MLQRTALVAGVVMTRRVSVLITRFSRWPLSHPARPPPRAANILSLCAVSVMGGNGSQVLL